MSASHEGALAGLLKWSTRRKGNEMRKNYADAFKRPARPQERDEDLDLAEALGDFARELRKERQELLGGETVRLPNGSTTTFKRWR